MKNPEAVNLMQGHWREKGPIHEAIEDAMTHVATAFTDEYTLRAQYRTFITSDVASAFADRTSVGSFDKTTAIPPAVFGEVTHDKIELREPAVVPETDVEIDAMAQRYDKWRADVLVEEPFNISTFTGVDVIASALKKIKGERIPADTWRLSAQATQADLVRPVRIHDTHYANRLQNAAPHHSDLPIHMRQTHKASDRYVVVQSMLLEQGSVPSSFRDIIQLPVTEYGEEAAKKLAAATVDMNDIVKTGWGARGSANAIIDAELDAILLKHTTRTKDEKSYGVCEYASMGLRHSLAEGVYSMSQMISYLTAERHEAFASHDDYVRAILDSDVLERFTKSLRVGYLGPLSLAGLYKPNMLDVSDDGKVSLNKERLIEFGRQRKEYAEKIATDWVKHEEDGAEEPHMLGLPCPGIKAITQLKEAFKVHYR